jgi:NTP pyrophosphatase (non-canonical NTP hydrolase)
MGGAKGTNRAQGQILLFPGSSDSEDLIVMPGDASVGKSQRSSKADRTRLHRPDTHQFDVVLCGTFRKDPEGLKRTFEQLRDLGCRILSPGNVEIVSEADGFVFMRGEEMETPERLELKHLDAIQHARFIWLHAPEGYVGPTAALEIGFARASGIPVFSSEMPKDVVFQKFVRIVASPQEVMGDILPNQIEPPVPALQTFQHYYRRAALERGYESESAQNCLLLMMEEVGELARALRKREKIVRHGTPIDNQEALELADVFIYVVHMANILHLDLGKAVQNKEILNIRKTLKLS